MSHSVLLIAGSVFSLMIGFSIATQSWNGISYWKLPSQEKKRELASFEGSSTFGVTKTSLSELYEKDGVVLRGKILESKELIGISLGHFIDRVGLHRKDFVCNKYNKVDLFFYARDLLVSGHPPSMKVTADCSVSDDLGRLSTIWVPIKKLYQMKAKNMNFSSSGIRIVFSGMGFVWPTQWGLRQVSFYSSLDKMFKRDIDLENLEFSQRALLFLDVKKFIGSSKKL